MKKGSITALVIFIILVVVASSYALSNLYAQEQEGDVSYETKQAETLDIVKKSVATGAVEPRQEVEVKPQVSGLVRELLVEAGDTVQSGDLLARVDIVADIGQLSNAESRINRARINLDNAIKDYERNAQLLEDGVISEASFQLFDVSQRTAKEELAAAEDNLAIIQKGVAKRGRSGTNTLIKATIPGMVLDVPIKVGNSVIEANNFNDGTTICSIADMTDMIFKGKIDESEVEKLKSGMNLILTIGAIENRTFDAELEYIAPKGILENGAIQFEIKAAVKIPSDVFIRAGYSANADVVLEKREKVLAISEALVQYEKDQPFVEVEVGTNQYEKREVQLGLSDGINVEVLSGVTKEEKIKLWNKPITEEK